ncbi:S10 family serine carboxypeptidase-like protein [Nannocystis pusilla]|uniref:S10 family serine carboxypeptidase-like protein n=1 Tax=Nannocystis pusilla TaxID=889268 RepID=UPI003DA41869
MPAARTLSLLVLLAACGGGAASPVDASETLATATETTAPEPTAAPEPTTGTATTDAPVDPICCGCLCVDAQWSCSADTCVYPDGTAAALAPEAGFLAIAAHTFSTFDHGVEVVRDAPEARMWYAFRPADGAPETRPLAVFFNGGPGYSSATLFGMNTNAVTLDPDIAGDAVVAPNPHSWTRFANVLYPDPRGAGYSYDVAPAVGEPQPLEFVPEHDAADFVRVVLAFLARHPQLRSNPVILVGESYGGNRSALMLGQFLHPGRLAKKSRYYDPSLREAVLAHYAAVFPDAADLTPQRLAEQFGHQVLIQPAITWLQVPDVPDTPDDQQMLELGCVPDPDYLQCDEPQWFATARTGAAVAALTDPPSMGLALGVDAASIEWLHADAREGAVPRGDNGVTHDESGLRAVFGELPAGEAYYLPYNYSGDDTFNWRSAYYGYIYLESFYGARTFITDAGKDLTVHAPDIPAKIAGYTDVITAVVHDEQPVAGEARPGRLVLKYAPGLLPGDPEVIVRHPHYPVGGHIVSLKQGGELAEDVCRWFADDCPLP